MIFLPPWKRARLLGAVRTGQTPNDAARVWFHAWPSISLRRALTRSQAWAALVVPPTLPFVPLSLLLISALALGCARAPSFEKPSLPAPAPPPKTSPTAAASARPDAAPPAANDDEPEPSTRDAPPVEERQVSEVAYAFRDPLPPRELARGAPALFVSNLSPGACAAELRRRNLPVARDAGAAVGVARPVRITGAMHGVRFVTPSRKSVYGKLDCRLALALDELSKVLARHGVAGVRVDNLYRPNARLAGTRTRSQHRYGLAVDVVSFELESGLELSVEHDWHGALESPPCGPESSPSEPSEKAIALREIVCDVAKSGLFNHILTPNFNAAHRDHLHLDIKRGDPRWTIE